MHDKLTGKIEKLINIHATMVRMRVVELLNSGAINEDDYKEDDFTLAKVLTTAALRSCSDNFLPSHPKHRSDCENLGHF